MRPEANYDLIIMLSTEMRPVPKCSLACSKTGVITSYDFLGAFSSQTGIRALMRPIGVIAISIIL